MILVTSRFHAVLDYLTAVLLLATPWLFGFAGDHTASAVVMMVGFAILLLSAATDYEYGLVKYVSFPFHLLADIVISLFLVASPWLFTFSSQVYWPHVLIGLFSFLVVSMTVSVAYTDRYSRWASKIAPMKSF